MLKSQSCGIIITDNKKILICLPTNNIKWDIPKGKQDQGETYIETALRETFEETGIKLDPNDLIELGNFQYKINKDLFLYKYMPNLMPNAEDLTCTSYFTDEYGKHPEMEKFAIVDIDKAIKMVNSGLSKILIKIFKENI